MTDPGKNFEDTPLSRAEYIAGLVHLYRGEVYRATQWRLRLDTTTNWSILSVMALVTFSLGEPGHSHAAVLVGMALVHTFLHIEARRYRYFMVWQHRVRVMERNFYGPIISRDLQSPSALWGQRVADDLLRPRFPITKRQAVRGRLIRNYWPLFGVLLLTWLLKLGLHPALPGAPFWQQMALGALPFWVAPALIACEYLYLLWIWLAPSHHAVKVDELDDELDGLSGPPH